LRRCHIGEYRFSEDLDFTLLYNDVTFEQIRAAFDEVSSKVRDRTGMDFRFDAPDPKSHQNSHTFFMRFTGPMGAERRFKVDITIAECIVGDLERRPVILTYEEYDFPDGASVKAYSLDEIATEKIVALTDKQRTQPRDLYDLWYLSSEGHVDITSLAHAVAAKLDIRQRSAEGLHGVFKDKEAALKRAWETRLSPQMADIPEFGAVFRETDRLFRQSKVFDAALTIQKQR
jgi:predicted nucleotidyltransferase component of viral defense system